MNRNFVKVLISQTARFTFLILAVFCFSSASFAQTSVTTVSGFPKSANGNFTVTGASLYSGTPASPTFPGTATSAILNIPAGSTVTDVYLYWGVKGTTTVDSAVTLTGPGGSFTTSASSPGYLSRTIGSTSYSVRVNATSLLSWTSGTYTLGGVSTSGVTVSTSNYAGWGLIVFYTNPNDRFRALYLNDGFIQLNGNTQTTNYGTTNTYLTSLLPLAKLGYIAGGTQIAYCDDAQLNGTFLTTSATNYSGASITKTPNFLIENAGVMFDAQEKDASSAVSHLQTNASFSSISTNCTSPASSSSQDFYDWFALPFSVTVRPDVALTKSVDKVTAATGDTLTYSIGYTNSNTYTVKVNAEELIITDAIPTGSRYVLGSMTATDSTAVKSWSVDGGTLFSTTEPTSATSVTHVRWTINGPLAPSITPNGSVGFQTTVTSSGGATITNTATGKFRDPGTTSTTPDGNQYNTNSPTASTTIPSTPDLTLSKSHSGSFTIGSSGTYTFTVTNSGTASTSGTITVTDTLPSGLTVNGGAVGAITEGGTNVADWTCNSAALTGSPARQTITCTSSTAIAASGNSVFNFAVNVGNSTAIGTNSITNTASVSGGGEVNTTNNSGSDSTTVISPDLTVAKSHLGNFTRGSTGTYTFTVSNSGTAATSGTVTVSDTLPTGLSIADGTFTPGGTNGTNWSCTAASNAITCTSSTAIATSGSSVFSFSVSVVLSAASSITNSVGVSGGNEATANNGNNTANDPTTVVTPIGCSEVYAAGWDGSTVLTSLYRLNGSTMTAIYTAPQKVGGLAISSNGSAYYDNGTFSNPPLYRFDGSVQTNTGMTLPTLNVGEAADAAGNVYYIDSAYHLRKAPAGGSGAAIDLGALVFDADDTIGPAMRYGDMTFDGTGRLYWYGSIANGAGRTYLYTVDQTTLAAKSLGDIGPDGATGVAFDTSGNLITTRNSGATVVSISLATANLDGTTIGTASPSIYDLGSCASPILNPNLLSVTKSVVNITQNQNPATLANTGDVLEYTIVVNNNGNMPSYDAKLSDAIPAGTTYVAGSTTMNGTSVTDVSGVMPFVSSHKINSTNQTSGVVVATGNSTIKFRVTVNSGSLPATIDNTAIISYPTMSAGTTTVQSVNSNTTSTPTVAPVPNVGLVKSCPSPTDCTTAPQAPGTDVTYKIGFTNTGGVGASNLRIVDAIPTNMDYKLSSATVNTATTGLSVTIEFSSDYDPLTPSAATWSYTPVSGGGGASAGYDRLVKAIRWRVTSGTLSNVSPNNTGDVSFIAKIR